MQDLKSLLNKSIQRAGITRQVDAVRVVEIAGEIIEELFSADIVSQVRPIYVKNKTLAIASLSSIASQEIRFREKEIIDMINERLGLEAVSKIRYTS